MAQESEAAHNREVLERFNEILRTRDYDALEEVLAPEIVQVTPQTGERARGVANMRKILEHLPGESSAISVAKDPYISGEGPHYVMTPTFNVVKVEGSGDELTSYVRATYPDGSEWYVISFTSFRDGKISKRVDFFAPMLEAPDWRAEWVERTDT